MTAARFVYVTCASAEQAEAIGRALVEERLAACANILPGATSIYRWEGKIAVDREAALVLKSRAELIAPLTARVKALHSYTVPCVVALPIESGNADYLAWIARETATQSSIPGGHP
jgi:periplasmic divalent cation tolerance protein